MAYSPTYNSDDVSPVVIDAGTKILVQIGAFAAIFGVLLALAMGAWAMKKLK